MKLHDVMLRAMGRAVESVRPLKNPRQRIQKKVIFKDDLLAQRDVSFNLKEYSLSKLPIELVS
jgi:hypothetical protein